ncbi:putative ATP-dependent RNA helicase TDRD12 [Latimeria chalumnae]|uniref:putative ATP-dependent RNA helicase TDRD12 n=1 Tax=Latimeria chalumnae TaxID=7897 RepID=UPI00313E316F
MIEIKVLKIEDPSCFWGRIIRGCGDLTENAEEYEKLQDKMNQLYHGGRKDLEEIKLSTLEEGQVCVVYCKELRCWCRAVVESLMSSANDYLAECFLVDYAKYVNIQAKNVRGAIEAFVKLPYRAKKFRLYGIKPLTLSVDLYEDKAKIIPARRWDSAAIQHFQSIVKASSQTEAKLCAIEEDFFDVQLYVTYKDEKACVNDELVAKNFACCESPRDHKVRLLKNQDTQSCTSRSEASFEKMIKCEKVSNLARTLWPGLLQGRVLGRVQEVSLERHGDNQTSFLNSESTSDSYKKTCDVGKVDLASAENLNHCKLPSSPWNQVLVHSVTKVTPCTTLEMAPISEDLKKCLIRNKFVGPNLTESYCWPAVARGGDLIAVSHSGNNPLVYIPPLVTFIWFSTVHSSLPTRNGPLAVIVCPGWKKAQHVFDLLEEYTRCFRPLRAVLILVGLNKEEVKNVKLAKGCEVVVTTPNSLTRLLKRHCFLFLRLCHLVLDEVDLLFAEANDQMLAILEYYKRAITAEERASAPQQIIAVGTRWDKHLENVVREHMSDPYIVVTAMEEASVYGNVHQVVQICLDSAKTSLLLSVLNFTSDVLEKTLIFTSSVEEADVVFKTVATSAFAMIVHEDLSFRINEVLEEWNKKFSSGTRVVLVLTDACIQALGITDATCVVHYGFPASPRIFGARLGCMIDNFRNLTDEVGTADREFSKAKSVLLLTDRNACHAVGVLRFLEHTEAQIPPALVDFTAGILKAKEEMKYDRPLCTSIKLYGVCRDSRMCPDRHQVHQQLDTPRRLSENETIPTEGCVSVLPLHIINATNYFGRIVKKQEDQYKKLEVEMNNYYSQSCNRLSAKDLNKYALYGLQEGTVYLRVQFLEVIQREEDCLFYTVDVKYIDEGRTGYVKGHQLLVLPEKFNRLPPQAVEFIACRVKPIDNETDWNPKVSRHILQKIKEVQHEAKIVLSLGNTVWIDPVVRVTKLKDLNTSINEYNIRSEILATGMGVNNPEHIKQLQVLCREAMSTSDDSISKLQSLNGEESLDYATLQRDESYHAVIITEFFNPSNFYVQIEENQKQLSALENKLNSFTDPEDDALKNYIPAVGNICLAKRENRWQRVKILTVDSTEKKCQVLCLDYGSFDCISFINVRPWCSIAMKLPFQMLGTILAILDHLSMRSDNIDVMVAARITETLERLHPEINWHQKPDTITLKVRIRNVTQPKCEFRSDQVIFSAFVGDKFYVADLELYDKILTDKSVYVIKYGEPVITLVKENKGAWCSLLKKKNIHVTFDFEHLEEVEEKHLPSGKMRFRHNVHNCYFSTAIITKSYT